MLLLVLSFVIKVSKVSAVVILRVLECEPVDAKVQQRGIAHYSFIGSGHANSLHADELTNAIGEVLCMAWEFCPTLSANNPRRRFFFCLPACPIVNLPQFGGQYMEVVYDGLGLGLGGQRATRVVPLIRPTPRTNRLPD